MNKVEWHKGRTPDEEGEYLISYYFHKFPEHPAVLMAEYSTTFGKDIPEWNREGTPFDEVSWTIYAWAVAPEPYKEEE